MNANEYIKNSQKSTQLIINLDFKDSLTLLHHEYLPYSRMGNLLAIKRKF